MKGIYTMAKNKTTNSTKQAPCIIAVHTGNFNPSDIYHERLKAFIDVLKTTDKGMDYFYNDLVNSMARLIWLNNTLDEHAKNKGVKIHTWEKRAKKDASYKNQEHSKITHAITKDMIKLSKWYKGNRQCDIKKVAEKVNKMLHKRADCIHSAVLYGGCSKLYLECLCELNAIELDFTMITQPQT